jgi:hypothetical protein
LDEDDLLMEDDDGEEHDFSNDEESSVATKSKKAKKAKDQGPRVPPRKGYVMSKKEKKEMRKMSAVSLRPLDVLRIRGLTLSAIAYSTRRSKSTSNRIIPSC